MIILDDIKNMTEAELKYLREIVARELAGRKYKNVDAASEKVLDCARYMDKFVVQDIIDQLGMRGGQDTRVFVSDVLRAGGYENVVLYCGKQRKAIRRWRKGNI